MKNDIHPTYFANAKVTCNCGASFVTGATMESIHVEVCSECHPFYTGKSNLVDTAGRVDQFRARTEKAKAMKAAKTVKKVKTDEAPTEKVTSGREALKALRKTVAE